MSDSSGPLADPATHASTRDSARDAAYQAAYEAAGRDVRLALRGLCDGRAAAGHRARVRDLLQLGPAALVVDLGRPRRLSSDTVGLLLWLHRTCLERGVMVVVTGPPRRGAESLRRNGLLTPGTRPGPVTRRRRSAPA